MASKQQNQNGEQKKLFQTKEVDLINSYSAGYSVLKYFQSY